MFAACCYKFAHVGYDFTIIVNGTFAKRVHTTLYVVNVGGSTRAEYEVRIFYA